MRTNMLRSIAVTLALGVGGTAQAQYAMPESTPSDQHDGSQSTRTASIRSDAEPRTNQPSVPAAAARYQPPAKWSHFGTDSSATIYQPVSDAQEPTPTDPLPIPPAPEQLTAPRGDDSAPAAQPPSASAEQNASGSIDQQESVGESVPNPRGRSAEPAPPVHAEAGRAAGSGHPRSYQRAMQAPWSGAPGPHVTDGYSTLSHRTELYPWFGGTNLLFLTLENDSSRRLLVDGSSASRLSTDRVEPEATVGFDIHAGRYVDGGRYGLSVGYFLFNPDDESQIVSAPMAGAFSATIPQWNDVTLDPGSGADTVYNHFDGASAFRLRRDIRFQGIEANLTSFGILGAQRAAARCGNGLSDMLDRFGVPRAWGHKSCGYGGAAGPLVRPTSGRVQVATSHGFRWFKLEDELEYAADINGTGGFQANDVYYNVETENNLYGYQFGSRMTYCLSNRWNLGLGGKFGIYANDVEYRQRLGTRTTLAYPTGSASEEINTASSDTVLATLGELDLGLGYRLSNAWTVRGGYRLIGLTGVATSTGSIASEYSSLTSSGSVQADDSMILHGGYAGLEFNW